MILSKFRNQRGVALIGAYMATAVIATVAAATYAKALSEMRQVDREVTRTRTFAAAEAGLQTAMAQIAQNAYTGFINTNSITVSNFQSAGGTSVGSYNVSISYPNEADWVVVTAQATVNGDTRTVEGRVFLDSNLSKYLVYANASSFSSGTDAQYGEPDMTDEYGDGTPDYPQYVSPDENDRAALYFTGIWDVSGSNVHLYGDAHAENYITGVSSSYVHGDTYSSAFAQSGSTVTNDGVSGSLNVGDGFSDDLDRNGNGTVNSADYPDFHDLTADGAGDAHATETITQINHTFYAANNNTPSFVGASAANRYLKFETTNGGTQTVVKAYTSSTYATLSSTTTLPANAIVYVKGDAYVKGEIGGRVTIVASDDIMIAGNFTYHGGQTTADAGHSTALLAKDIIYFQPNDLTASGILYAENSSNSSVSFDSNYNTSGNLDPNSKSSLSLSGNRVIKGSTNLSNYDDRVYGYDPNLKYFRPPGIPVVPDLRVVREK